MRNYQARNFMREMAVGDRGFFYHSQKERAVVGTVEVIAEAHPDSTTDDDRWECVDIKALQPARTRSRSTTSRRSRDCRTWSS